MDRVLIALFVMVSFFPGCSPEEIEDPVWVQELIDELASAPVRDPPASIVRYEYHNMTVYYVPPYCCDAFSVLYDFDGSVICAPDGGLSGGGDGGCPDFFKEATHRKVIWQDSRE